MINDNQLPERFREIIEDQIEIYKQKRTIQDRNNIPDTTEIPIENPTHWFKIPDVISVFVDMMGSTKLSASSYDKSTAGAYNCLLDLR